MVLVSHEYGHFHNITMIFSCMVLYKISHILRCHVRMSLSLPKRVLYFCIIENVHIRAELQLKN